MEDVQGAPGCFKKWRRQFGRLYSAILVFREGAGCKQCKIMLMGLCRFFLITCPWSKLCFSLIAKEISKLAHNGALFGENTWHYLLGCHMVLVLNMFELFELL